MIAHKNLISSGQRIPELDGLRGVAILLVIAFHYVNNQLVHATHSVSKALAHITSFGWVGVDLFFVLSGFLIGSILISKKELRELFQTIFYKARSAHHSKLLPASYFLFHDLREPIV